MATASAAWRCCRPPPCMVCEEPGALVGGGRTESHHLLLTTWSVSTQVSVGSWVGGLSTTPSKTSEDQLTLHPLSVFFLNLCPQPVFLCANAPWVRGTGEVPQAGKLCTIMEVLSWDGVGTVGTRGP